MVKIKFKISLVSCGFCSLMAMLLLASPAWGAGQPPDPDKWYTEFQTKSATQPPSALGAIPHSVVFIEKFIQKKPPKVRSIPTKSFRSYGYLDTPDTQGVQYFFLLNTLPKSMTKQSKFKKYKEKDWIMAISVATQSDIVIDSSGSSWEGFAPHTNSEKIFESNPPKGEKASINYAAWVAQSLGYEAVILDKQEPYFLAALLNQNMKIGTQALAIKDSKDQYALKSPKGDGVLELKRSGKGVAVFELILPGSTGNNIPPGTKLSTGSAPK